ncbi:cytochrome P450 [Ktedonobacter sp. SOSP1-85]|uniref:cytochrome P450 n=1 Tax=Ktedonobacter sp. SOSP1-85 TaxID=2778367 RepID=UPI0019166083|nr:cytochrome P450 [Ktedonobacter sp. SOSP1-85]GHO80339.1 cytochrome P450 [Ktedonobacter sp. SOSP1-85]
MAQDVIKAPTERTVPRLTRREGFSLIINSDPLGIPLRLARKYGDVFFMEAGGQKVFFLNHPDDVRELLVVQHEKFYKGDGVMQLARMLGQGLVTSEDPLHKRQRRLVQPAFHRKRIAGYTQAMVEAAQEQARNWRDGATVDMVEEMMELTLIIVGKTLFNTDVAREADTVQQALVTSMEAFRKLSMSPLGALVERLPLPINARLRQAREQLDAVVYRIIDEHRKQGNDQGDLLSMLLLAQDEDGSVMTDQQLRDEVMTLFLAGHETTSNALAWTWYLLAQHPEFLARLQQEVDSVLADRAASIDDLPRLPYTEQVLMESMRICPPIWAIDRNAIEDVNLRGIYIPKGSKVVLSQYVVQHDPRFYPEPERFDPERWTPEARAERPKFAYFPFGGGPRLCIGESFAWTEGILLLATLAQRWEARLAPGAHVAFQPAVTLRPKYGLKMTLHRRAV